MHASICAVCGCLRISQVNQKYLNLQLPVQVPNWNISSAMLRQIDAEIWCCGASVDRLPHHMISPHPAISLWPFWWQWTALSGPYCSCPCSTVSTSKLCCSGNSNCGTGQGMLQLTVYSPTWLLAADGGWCKVEGATERGLVKAPRFR